MNQFKNPPVKNLIASLLIFISMRGVSQEWHKMGDTLRLPRGVANVFAAVGAAEGYDTVSIMYKTTGADRAKLLMGYKRVYVRHGFYIDDASTVNVFFDDRLKRVTNVRKFYFD